MANNILTPINLWDEFNSLLPLKETVLKSETIGNAVFNYVYFSGRQIGNERVRIYGIYAEQKNLDAGTIIIIPSVDEPLDADLVLYFSNAGFNVLAVDIHGKCDNVSDFTVYPSSISYANYVDCGRTFDYVDNTAKETCWYEWSAVIRYAVSYAKEKNPDGKIGLLGVKHGANVAWQVTAVDDRVDASAFLFGAGWRAYKGVFKNTQEEIELDDERCRFIAGVDAHSYAQLVKVPVLYLGATNNAEFDVERAVDTLQRVDNHNKTWQHFINVSIDSLDRYCLTDLEIFFSKFIANKKIKIPSIPKLTVEVDGEDATYIVDCADIDNVEKVQVFASSNDMNPAERVWFMPLRVSSNDKTFKFERRLYGVVDFEIAYAVVRYKNGMTLSSKFTFDKLNVKSNSKIPNVIFSSSRLLTRFMFKEIKVDLLSNVICDDKIKTYLSGPLGILGISTKNKLISYSIGKFADVLSERSFIKFDVFTSVPDVITIELNTKNGLTFSQSTTLTPCRKWQNLTINLNEFKTEIGMPIKDFSEINSICVSSKGDVAINNFLVL